MKCGVHWMYSKFLYGAVAVVAVLALALLFFQIHPERWLRGGEAAVTMTDIEAAGTTVSFAGKKAGDDIPRLSGAEDMLSLYPWEHFTVAPKDAIPTGVYELARWESNSAVVMHRRRTFPYATTGFLLGHTNYNEFYVIEFPDGTYSLALFDAKIASRIANGEEVTLPVCVRSSANTEAFQYLRDISSSYGVSPNNIIYAFDDEWFIKNELLILVIKIAVILGIIVIFSLLWAWLSSAWQRIHRHA